MNGLRERALAAYELDAMQMNDWQIRERRARNRKLRRIGTRKLRKDFGLQVDKADWQGDGQPWITVEGVTFVARFERGHEWQPVELLADGHRVWDLASLGKVIARAELLASR